MSSLPSYISAQLARMPGTVGATVREFGRLMWLSQLVDRALTHFCFQFVDQSSPKVQQREYTRNPLSRPAVESTTKGQLGLGAAALVTGGGSGIGRAVSLALPKRGINVTVVDYCEAGGKETVRLVEKELGMHKGLASQAPPAIFIKCDVSVPEQLSRAFLLHENTYGRLDILLNNAGIVDNSGKFWDDVSWDGTARWRKVVDVNLSAVIDGTRLGIQVMRRTCKSGVIVNIASAVGLYPSPHAPIYSATKGGVVMLTRSLAGLQSEGIRVNALCPEHIKTKLTKDIPQGIIKDGYISIDVVLKGIFELIEDETQAGACLWLTNREGAQYWPTPESHLA